jgi:hypothetical protein
MLRIKCAVLFLALWLSGAFGCGSRQRTAEAPAALKMVRQTEWEPWEAWRLRRAERPPLDVFFAHTSEPKPLVVLLQGSGCAPLLAIAEGGRLRMSSLLVQPEDLAADVHLMAVEQVGSSPGRRSVPPGCHGARAQRRSCSGEGAQAHDHGSRLAARPDRGAVDPNCRADPRPGGAQSSPACWAICQSSMNFSRT